MIEQQVLPSELLGITAKNNQDVFSLSENKKEAIIEALKQANNNKSEAAKLLKITRKTLYNKLNFYGLDY